MGSILFLLELCVWLYDCPECVSEQQSSLNLVSRQELYACPRAAYIGIVSRVGFAPPLTVLLGHLMEQIVLTEPLRIAYFLTAGTASGKISLVQITAPYSGLGGFLHDHLGTVMVRTCFSGRFRTFSGPHGQKFLLPSYRFCPNWPPRCRTYARSHRRRKMHLYSLNLQIQYGILVWVNTSLFLAIDLPSDEIILYHGCLTYCLF